MVTSKWIGKGDFVYREKKPLIYTRSYDVYLEDINGKIYFDAEAANGAALLGYDPTIIQEAVEKIRDIPSLPSFAESELRLKVAEKLGKLLLKVTNVRGRVAFEIGGAQAIELAIKLAKKKYWENTNCGLSGRVSRQIWICIATKCQSSLPSHTW